MGIEGEERDQLVVVGDGVDATSLTSCLRKTVKVGRADLIKVEVVDEKAATMLARAAATGCSNPVAAWPPQGYPYGYHPGYGYYCPRTGGVVYPYAAGRHCYVSRTPTTVRGAPSCRCARMELGNLQPHLIDVWILLSSAV